MKKISLIVMVIGLAILICSCGLATESEIMMYAKNHYGEAEIINTDEISESEIKYYLKDSEYGFEYYIRSYLRKTFRDGRECLKSEKKESDFNLAYHNYIVEQIDDEFTKLEDKYNVEIIEDSVSNKLTRNLVIEINYKKDNLKTAPNLSKKVNDLYMVYDNRHYWKAPSRIYVYDKNKEKIGYYDSESSTWLTSEQEDDVFYIKRGKELDLDAVYLRKEEKLFKDTGLSLDDVADVLGEDSPTENSVVTYYYFEVDGKEFFLADVLVNPNARWYSNYDKVIEK